MTGVLARGSTEVRVDVVPVPRDCMDGFGEAYYARPEAFLQSEVRAAMSGVVLTDRVAVERALARLEADLATGAWDRTYGHWRDEPEYHGALRLVTATT